MTEKMYGVNLTATQLSLLISTLDLYLAVAWKSKEKINTQPEETLYTKLKSLLD